MSRSVRALAVLIVLLILVLVGGSIIYKVVLSPVLDVQSGDKATVYDAAGKLVVDASAASHIRLSPGTYTIEASGPDGAASMQTYTLKLRSRQPIAVDSSAKAPNPVKIISTVPGIEASQDGGQLIYLDTSRQLLSRVGSDNVAQTIAPADSNQTDDSTASDLTVTQIATLGGNKKLIATTGGTLYVRSAGSNLMQPLSFGDIDTTALNQQQVLIAGNPTESDFMVAIGQTLYHYDSAESDPVQVAHLTKLFNHLVFGGGKFLAFDTTMPYSTTDITDAYGQQNLVYPVLADLNKHSVQLPSPILDASISPDGQHIVIDYRQTTAAKLYTIDGSLGLNSATGVPRPTGLAPVWLNPDSFVYYANSALWTYSVASQVAGLFARTSGLPPSSITPQGDGSIIFTASTSSGRPLTYRAGPDIGGSTTNTLNQIVSQGLANENYVMTYTDLGQPSFLLSLILTGGITGSTGIADAVSQASQQATAALNQDLLGAGIDPSSVTIKTAY